MGVNFISLFYNLQPANFTFNLELIRVSRLSITTIVSLCDCFFEPKESEWQAT
jgi:hypothetical protein